MTPRPPDSHQNGQLWPYSEAGRYVEAGGVRWHLLRLGTGPQILLLHGSASSTHAWAGVSERLRDRFSLVIPDLPGHGHSSQLPEGRGGVDDLARALDELLRVEKVDPVLAVGHSAGAVLAIRAASRGWIRPHGLLGVNPALGSRDSFLPPVVAGPLTAAASSSLLARAGAGLFRGLPLAQILLRSTGSRITPEISRRYQQLLGDPGRVRGVIRLMADWVPDGAGSEAAGLGIPVRFLTGSEDRWVSPAVVRAHASGIPVAEVPDRGHLLPEEDPAAVADAIEALGVDAGL